MPQMWGEDTQEGCCLLFMQIGSDAIHARTEFASTYGQLSLVYAPLFDSEDAHGLPVLQDVFVRWGSGLPWGLTAHGRRSEGV